VLPCELARGHRDDALGLEPLGEVGEPELVEGPPGVDQDVRVGTGAAEDVDLVEERRVLDDQRVRLDDGLARADRPVVDPAERRDGRPRPLGAERGERDRRPSVNAATESSSAAVTTPCPPRPWMRISNTLSSFRAGACAASEPSGAAAA
jgi:hypothetical protein